MTYRQIRFIWLGAISTPALIRDLPSTRKIKLHDGTVHSMGIRHIELFRCKLGGLVHHLRHDDELLA